MKRQPIRLLALSCTLLFPVSGLAQYAVDPTGGMQTGGISVYGTGETSAKPDLVEISLRANASASSGSSTPAPSLRAFAAPQATARRNARS